MQDTKFAKADKEQLRGVFSYLEVCLEQVVKDNELGALKQALAGEYVEPGPGGDPIRNPLVLPTGKNIHALDPQSIPTQAAVKSAMIVVERYDFRLCSPFCGASSVLLCLPEMTVFAR